MRSSLLSSVAKFVITDYAATSLRHCSSCRRVVAALQQASTSMENYEDRVKRFFALEQVEPDVFRTSNLGTLQQSSDKAAYGGLIFAQALAAAENTVEDKLKPHAMHSFFILNVDTSIPVQYHVRRVRDGRSFCTRTVEAVQEGKIVFILQVSFHVVSCSFFFYTSVFRFSIVCFLGISRFATIGGSSRQLQGTPKVRGQGARPRHGVALEFSAAGRSRQPGATHRNSVSLPKNGTPRPRPLPTDFWSTLYLEPDSAVHQDVMPVVPSWEKLECLSDVIPWLKTEIAAGRIKVKPALEHRLKHYETRASQKNGDLFQIRLTSIDRHIGLGEQSTSRTFYSWVRSVGDLGDCEKLHRYLVAYTTDGPMGGSAFRPHYGNGFDPSMIFSLDHNVWMHKHLIRADQWMLFENTSTVAGKGRAFVTGKLWSEDGVLLLSCAQEIVLRSRGTVSKI
ncbi:hypothetical protein Y032_0559g3443 [Ancylostoma ceylanicum]|nr:hypothetical protein Y032_0559g3443 [Ancylostoma ceylanicum]